MQTSFDFLGDGPGEMMQAARPIKKLEHMQTSAEKVQPTDPRRRIQKPSMLLESHELLDLNHVPCRAKSSRIKPGS